MLAKIWNYRTWITETDAEALCKFFDNAIREAGFHVLHEIEHKFSPQGFTKLYLISESHLAIHTFPERGKTYIELSSCNVDYFNNMVRAIIDNCERTVSDAIAPDQGGNTWEDQGKK